jgi:hypothetical protein
VEEHEAERQGILANVPPPSDIGSWYHMIDGVIILDTTGNDELLHTAIAKVIGWDDTWVEAACVPGSSHAARGAAMRAQEWATLYDEGFLNYECYPSAWSDMHCYKLRP